MTDLVLFAQPELTAVAVELGIAAVMVDLESRGKQMRQQTFDTEISAHDIADLARTRSQTTLPIICRVDPQDHLDRQMLTDVLDAGADEILLPMISRPDTVERVLDFVEGQAKVCIMVETVEGVRHALELARLPICRAYVGLNDLWIERRTNNRFEAFVDGTIDMLAEHFRGVPFGVAGLTHPLLGAPLACQHLINELSRLECDFTVLRRSFLEALNTYSAPEVVDAIVAALAQASRRSPAQTLADHDTAIRSINQLPDELPQL